MELNNEKLETIESLNSFLKKATGQYPNKEEVAEVIEAVLKVVAELKDILLQKVETSSSELTEKVERVEERMKAIHAKMEKKTTNEIDIVVRKVYETIEEVKDLIPPSTDLSSLESKVVDIEKKIPTIPDEITPEIVKNKLESLEGEDRLDKSSIKGLDEELKRLDSKPTGSRGGARKITYVKRYNLTSQLNGVLKTFTLPADTIEVIGVWGTEFPINFNPGTDWTFSGRTLTLTSEVSAPQTGQTLYCLIETLFYG